MPAMKRLPAGYVGTNHETIGLDVLAILKVIQMPDLILGRELTESLRKIDPAKWYPMEMLYDPVELLHKKIGDSSLIRIGSELFRMTHAKAVKEHVRSARELLYGLDGLYRRANRGQNIGGWKVVSFERGKAIVEKTTPYHCVLEQGILIEALETIGVPANVEQRRCFRGGDDLCEYAITSFVKDARWNGDGSKGSAAR
jgi:hypothetical protein